MEGREEEQKMGGLRDTSSAPQQHFLLEQRSPRQYMNTYPKQQTDEGRGRKGVSEKPGRKEAGQTDRS